MNNIDKISEKIGSLTSSMKATQRTCDRILEMQEKSSSDIIRLEMKSDVAHSRLDELEPEVEKHNTIINKWTGFALGISTIAAILGSIITKIFFP